MTDTFTDLFPAFPRIDREWQAHKDRLMALTPAQRVAAMRAGELSLRELTYWSAVRPDEVPRIATGSGILDGEFEWIAAYMPEVAEAIEPTNPASQQRQGTKRDR